PRHRRAAQPPLRRGDGPARLGAARRGLEHARRRRLRPRGGAGGRPADPTTPAPGGPMSAPARVFLLSPAHCGGERAGLLFRQGADFDLARRVRRPPGVPLGEVFSFLSGLYFRGKLAYAHAFASPPAGLAGVYVITPNEGLRRADELVDLARLRAFARVDIDADDSRYHRPLRRDARL